MAVVVIFICGFLAGDILTWIAYKLPKEEHNLILRKFERLYWHLKKIISKKFILNCLVGMFYCLFYFKYKISIDFFRYSLVCPVLFVVALIDYKTQNVYFSTTFIGATLSVMFIIISFLNGISIKTYVFGGVLGAVFSSILAILKVIGWGDVEIFIVCGFLVGTYRIIIVAFISIILCGMYGVLKLIIKKDNKLRTAFGPYIFVSLVAVIISSN